MAITACGVCPLLEVFDMPASLRFYRDGIGFRVIRSSPPGDRCDWAWLELDGAELMLNTAYEEDERPPAPDPGRVLGHGDTTLFFGCPDVDAAYGELAARGLAVEKPTIRDYGMKQLSLTDPDGFKLCFQSPAA